MSHPPTSTREAPARYIERECCDCTGAKTATLSLHTTYLGESIVGEALLHLHTALERGASVHWLWEGLDKSMAAEAKHMAHTAHVQGKRFVHATCTFNGPCRRACASVRLCVQIKQPSGAEAQFCVWDILESLEN